MTDMLMNTDSDSERERQGVRVEVAGDGSVLQRPLCIHPKYRHSQISILYLIFLK